MTIEVITRLRSRTHQAGEQISRLRRHAKERAARSGRGVPWQVLQETRNRYLEWQEFYYWARSIIDSEGGIPEWLGAELDEICPDFRATQKEGATGHAKDACLSAVRLGEWIDQKIFAFADRGGWLPAVTYYAVREPRYQRASTCWSESVQKWRTGQPQEYPSLEQWLREAGRCDESAHLLPEIRKQRECFKLVDPVRLAETVTRYIDWEAFAYWARAALEQEFVVDAVARELDARCPGFRDFDARERTRDGDLPQHWHRLMLWIQDHYFQEAKTEAWFDAVVISADIHPRAIRTMEYADHCDEIWNGNFPKPYPAFENWRDHADRYVDIA